MGSDIPPEKVPRIYFLLKVFEVAPKQMRIVKRNHISFKTLIKWIRRNEPELYENLLKVYDCDDDTCLAMSMSKILLYLLESHISLQTSFEKVGDIDEALRGLGSRLYPILG